MDLEERTLEDSLERRCQVCETVLTTAEIEAARESGGPFLCAVHATEEQSAVAEDPEAAPGDDAQPTP